MNRTAHFSKDGLARLAEKSSLAFLDLAKILDCNMYVNIGREPGFNREHKLFYSIQEASYYVAIQNIHTGGVITVLPPSRFIVKAHFNDTEGQQKAKDILKPQAELYGRDISILLKDESLGGELNRSLVLKGVCPQSVWSISIRLGNNGDPAYLEWENNSFA